MSAPHRQYVLLRITLGFTVLRFSHGLDIAKAGLDIAGPSKMTRMHPHLALHVMIHYAVAENSPFARLYNFSVPLHWPYSKHGRSEDRGEMPREAESQTDIRRQKNASTSFLKCGDACGVSPRLHLSL